MYKNEPYQLKLVILLCLHRPPVHIYQIVACLNLRIIIINKHNKKPGLRPGDDCAKPYNEAETSA